jgi:diguanylate cyclase (GGDEF)-like protein
MRKTVASRIGLVVLGLAGAFLLAVLLAGQSLIWSTRQTALADSEAQATRFVAGAESALNRALLGVDVLLASTDELLGLSNSMADWIDSASASRLLHGAARQNFMVNYVALLDATGQVLASSVQGGAQLAVALPPGFREQVLAQPISTLMLSAPSDSNDSAGRVLYLARSIQLADKTRLLAVAQMQLGLLNAIMIQGVDIAGLEVTLERSNGQLLSSVPERELPAGQGLVPALGEQRNSAGVLRLPARLSALAALVVTRQILYPGVLIAASIPLDSVLGNWRAQRSFIVGTMAVFALMVLLAAALALSYLKRIAQARLTIAQSQTTLDQALESIVSGFLLLNAAHEVVRWNSRFEEIFPWLTGALTPLMSFRSLLQLTARHHLPQASDAQLHDWIEQRLALQWEPKDPHEQTLPNGRSIQITERRTPDGGLVIIYHDVTALRLASAEIENLAFYDPLTHLPNRRLLVDRMEQAMASSARSGREGALLFIDLDHFKTLNDTLGHDIGDLLLQQVALRLASCVREGDTVARLGGDEFVVMLADLSEQAMNAATQAEGVASKILGALNQPYTLATHEYRSTPSIGVALFDGHQIAIEEVLKQADIAMYQAKKAGRNTLRLFDPGMQSAITARAALELDLGKAILEREFLLYYQPQVDASGRVIGAEALLRWRHPERGLVSPAEFIPLAEETGLILPLGHWVLETACAQLAVWSRSPAMAELSLAVNVSARQFSLPHFVQEVMTVVQRTGVTPAQLKLELTESLLLDNAEDIIAKMLALKALGVSFSLDDFGTGYSSLSYLKRLPLDQLKIDRSFVRDVLIDPNDAAIARTVVALGQSLGLTVIAEGVETEAQRDFLAANGCLAYQGYLFSPPLPSDEFERFVRGVQGQLQAT